MRTFPIRPHTAAGRVSRAAATVLCLLAGVQPALAGCFNGVNLAGAEFGKMVGEYGRSYAYPSTATMDYFAEKGFNTVRLPFRWERIQRTLRGPLDPAELGRLKQSVADMRARKLTVVLDLHNFARYHEQVVGTQQVPSVALANLWMRLAKVFANQPGVVFGLMNEPFDMSPNDWLPSANAAIAAIRSTGAKNLVLVPGVHWTGAHSWQAESDGVSNATVMTGVRDPARNVAYEVHQYLDSDFSGTHDECTRAGDAADALRRMTNWLRANKARGFLGEFGGAATPDCMIGLARMVDTMAQANDVWIGWTYWAAGDWWSPQEPLNIQPTKDGDRLQLKALTVRPLAREKDACPALGRKPH